MDPCCLYFQWPYYQNAIDNLKIFGAGTLNPYVPLPPLDKPSDIIWAKNKIELLDLRSDKAVAIPSRAANASESPTKETERCVPAHWVPFDCTLVSPLAIKANRRPGANGPVQSERHTRTNESSTLTEMLTLNGRIVTKEIPEWCLGRPRELPEMTHIPETYYPSIMGEASQYVEAYVHAQGYPPF